MKVIDLLNKIANGEELPFRIKYDNKIYEIQHQYQDYVHIVENNGTMLFLIENIMHSYESTFEMLHTKLEVIQ